MKTIGGYEITDFEKLEEPEILDYREFIYKGKIDGSHWITNRMLNLFWDKNGKCVNMNREDCFIDVDVLAVVPK